MEAKETEYRQWALHGAPSLDVGALKSLAATHHPEIIADLENPAQGLAHPQRRLLAMRQAWLDAFTTFAPHADRAAMKALIEKGQWNEALTAACVPPPAAAGGDSGTLLGSEKENPPPALPPPPGGAAISLLTAPLSLQSSRALRAVSEFVLTGTAAERASLLATEKGAAALQSLIVSVVFLALVYGFYLKSWVGHVPEMLGIFAWAFSVDLTSDALIPLIKKAGNISPPHSSLTIS
jgi:hypothetical protein